MRTERHQGVADSAYVGGQEVGLEATIVHVFQHRYGVATCPDGAKLRSVPVVQVAVRSPSGVSVGHHKNIVAARQ